MGLRFAYLSWKGLSLRSAERPLKASFLALRGELRGSMFLLKFKIWNFERFKLTTVKKGSKFPCFSVVDLVEEVQTNLVWLQFFVRKFGMGKWPYRGAATWLKLFWKMQVWELLKIPLNWASLVWTGVCYVKTDGAKPYLDWMSELDRPGTCWCCRRECLRL